MKYEWNWRMSLLGGNFRSQGLSCQSPVPQVNKVSFSLDSWGMTMSRSCPHSHADHEIWGLFVKAAWPKLSWRYGRGAWISHVEGRQRDVSVFPGLCVSCREVLEGKDLRRQTTFRGSDSLQLTLVVWILGWWHTDFPLRAQQAPSLQTRLRCILALAFGHSLHLLWTSVYV